MRRPGLNLAQRIVLVVGSALTLYLLGLWLTLLGTKFPSGWVAFAPLSNSYFGPSLGGLHPWVRLVIWLFFIFLWIGFSMAVLATSPVRKDSHHD
jgi:hypothetical protein